MNSKLDEILYDALKGNDAPSSMLNHQILKKAHMEVKKMKSAKRNMVAAAAVILGMALVGGGTAYGRYRYMSAKSTAEYLGSNELSTCFDESEVVSTCEDGEYRFIYLGSASTTLKNMFLSNENTASTYVALAVERLDGKPVAEEAFVASPLIQGLAPSEYNIYSMGGGATWKEQDGILYMILSVDSIEMFADKTTYLAITTGPDYKKGFVYDSSTGLISANDDFDGINALFEIKLDASKADAQAQADYINKFAQNKDIEQSDSINIVSSDEVFKEFFGLNFENLNTETVETVQNKGTCIDSYEFEADANGNYHTKVENDYGSGEGFAAKESFTVNEPTLVVFQFSEEDGYVILEYNQRDENDILHVKHIMYDKKQMQDVMYEIRK